MAAMVVKSIEIGIDINNSDALDITIIVATPAGQDEVVGMSGAHHRAITGATVVEAMTTLFADVDAWIKTAHGWS